MNERHLLFVYGTLLRGHRAVELEAIRRRLRCVAPGTVRGELYDLGPYPAVVLGDDLSVIRGELVEVDCEQTWRELDEYEGCSRPGEGDGLFRRVRTVATLESGESLDCWIYVYNRDPGDARVIKSGCWRTHRGLL